MKCSQNAVKVLMYGTLAKGGMAVVIDNYMNTNFAKKYGIKFIQTHIETNCIYKYLYFFINFARSSIYLINPKYKIVHLHTSKEGSLLRKGFLTLVSKLLRKKVINHMHGGQFFYYFNQYNFFIKWFIKKVLNLSDKIIVLSEKRRIEYSEIVKVDKLVVIPNFIDIPKRKNKKRIGNVTNVISLGRLGKIKGTYDLIQAIQKLRNKDFHVQIGGDGDINEFRNLVKQLGLGNYVEILGWVTGKSKLRLLESADIFVLPSYYEDFPMAILEAMSFGLPILSTNIAGIPEMVENNVNGFLVEPGDIDELVSKLDKLISDRILRDKMGRNSLSIIKRKFEKRIVEKKIVNLYESLA